MADNFLERHREDYEQRKAAWLRRKKHLPKIKNPAILRPDDEALSSFPAGIFSYPQFYLLSIFYERMVNLANFRSNCLVPAFWNSTVAFVFSPVPSIFNTVPIPKR